MTECRIHPRVRANLSGVITSRLDRDHCDVLVRNLSLGGACISALTDRAMGSPLTLVFSLPAGRAPIKVAGKVRWSERAGTAGFPRNFASMGIRFTELLPADRLLLELFIHERLVFSEADQEADTKPEGPSITRQG